MARTMAVGAVVLAVFWSGSATAHHSLSNHDTATPVRVKGTVVQVHWVNPHSFIVLDETSAEGVRQRWAVEGPSGVQLARKGFGTDALKAGDAIEVCGYVPKAKTVLPREGTTKEDVSIAGRVITAELLVLPDGREQSWGDYGFHRCFAPGYKDQHSR